MKLKTKASDCQLIVKVKLPYGQKVDEADLNKFSRLYFSGFLRPNVKKPNKIEYTGPIGDSLFEYLKSPTTKRDVLQIIEQVVVAVQRLEKNNLKLEHLMMDMKKIYINKRTKIIHFLYVPIPNNQTQVDLRELIENILYTSTFAESEDEEFASRFIFYLKSMRPFDVDQVEGFIASEDKSVVNKIRKLSAGQSGFITDKQQDYYEYLERKKDFDEEKTWSLEDNTMILEEDNTALLDDEEKTGLLVEESEDTSLLIPEDEDDTALLMDNMQRHHFPTLSRVSTGEIISVNKPVFRLGKEKSYVDYFVTNNTAVSRGHADIITRGTQYYVLDLNSKNHTYVNEKIIPAHFEMEIQDGDLLKLGNEEFKFRV